MLTSGWPPMHEAHVSLPSDLRARLLLHPRPVPHQILLPACALLVHPGGAGTVAAALVSGCPQLLFPLHYDQAFWAERLTYLGLSPQPLDAAVLFNPAHRQASGETAEISPLSEGPVGPLSDMDQGPSSGRTRPLFDSSDESNGRARLLADRLSECLSSGIKKICQQMAKVRNSEPYPDVCVMSYFYSYIERDPGTCLLTRYHQAYHPSLSDLIYLYSPSCLILGSGCRAGWWSIKGLRYHPRLETHQLGRQWP